MANGIAHHTASTNITMIDKRPAGRLLIVEDDPEMSTGLLLFLESQGFDVKLANDGDKGLDEAVSLPGFDLLVLDAKLPGRGGFEILREVRNRGVSTPVLMLTASAVTTARCAASSSARMTI
jgi:DNA-binding response OmpR family regulator